MDHSSVLVSRGMAFNLYKFALVDSYFHCDCITPDDTILLNVSLCKGVRELLYLNEIYITRWRI